MRGGTPEMALKSPAIGEGQSAMGDMGVYEGH